MRHDSYVTSALYKQVASVLAVLETSFPRPEAVSRLQLDIMAFKWFLRISIKFLVTICGRRTSARHETLKWLV